MKYTGSLAPPAPIPCKCTAGVWSPDVQAAAEAAEAARIDEAWRAAARVLEEEIQRQAEAFFQKWGVYA